MNRFVWLASYPKSGNTWVRFFLTAYRHNGKLDINNAADIGFTDLQYYPHHLVSPIPLEKMDNYGIMAIRSAALAHLVYGPTAPGNIYFVKTHSALALYEGFPVIPTKWTNRALYIVRDPRDMVLSYADFCGVSHEDAVRQINAIGTTLTSEKTPLFHVISSWSHNVNSWAQNTEFRVGLVRYEDMVNEPEMAFTKVLEFLDWKIDPERFQAALKATTFDALQKAESENGFREKGHGDKFFRKGKIGQWKTDLDPALVQKIEEAHGDTMRKFGYLKRKEQAA